MPFGPGNPYRFQPGNPGGPGRPPRSQEDRILDAIIRNLPDDQLEEFARIVVEKAVHGSVKDRRLMLEYLVGTPVQRNRVDVSSEMVELLKNWRDTDKDST